MKLPFALSWPNLLLGSLPILALAGVIWGIHHHGYNSGKAKVEAEWALSKIEAQKETERLQAGLEAIKIIHAAETDRINDELALANETHAARLAAITASYDLRLRDSEARAHVYQRMSAAGPTDATSLASHAGQLDRSLEEGRRLVGELRSTLGQRDAEVKSLAEVIRADRKLMSGTNGN